MDKLVPFQNQKELDSMIKNATRDLASLKDFILKEKNENIRKQLEEILVASWTLARKYDGCRKIVMESPEFRKECREVFLLIAAQKRGGRKLFMNTTSSPVTGLNQMHFTWWSTVRGYQGSTLKFMDEFVQNLALPVNDPFSDSAISAGNTSNESLNVSDPSWIKNRLLKDVEKIIQDEMDKTGDLGGFGIGSSFNDGENSFLLTITLIPKDFNDSDVGDTDVDNSAQKKEPTVAHIVPKSESSRRTADTLVSETAPPLPKPVAPVPMEVDSDGFWTKYDRELPLSAEKPSPQGYKILDSYNRTQKIMKFMTKLKHIDRIRRFIETGELLLPSEPELIPPPDQENTAETSKGIFFYI